MESAPEARRVQKYRSRSHDHDASSLHGYVAKRPDTLSLDRVQAPTPSATPERLLEEKDEFRLMREIIDSLPTLQRTIIRMKDIEEYETEEIAEITGCNAEAIRSNLSRARKKVREVYLQTIQERKRRNKA